MTKYSSRNKSDKNYDTNTNARSIAKRDNGNIFPPL